VTDGCIYYGTGLCSPGYLSQGFPIDLLGMLLVAEEIRRKLDLRQVIHLVADSHAVKTRPDDASAIAEMASEQKSLLQKLIRNFSLDHFEVLIASEFDGLPSYTKILGELPPDENEYIRREIADIEWLRKERGLCLKVGWIIQAKETSLGFDERVFHRRYLELIDSPMSFVYVQAGRTFDKRRPKAAPYIVKDPEKRVVLDPSEEVRAKLKEAQASLGEKRFARLLEHYHSVVDLFEQVVEPLDRLGSLEAKMQYIIRQAGVSE
jgi:hypothetical protein